MHASGARKMNAVQLLQLKKLCGLAAFPGRLSFSEFPGALLMVSDPEEVLCPLKIRPFLPQLGCPKGCVGKQTGCVVVAKSRHMWPFRAAVKTCIKMRKSQGAGSESRIYSFEDTFRDS